MPPSDRKKYTDAFHLWLAQAFIASFRTWFRFMERFGSKPRRPKLRAFREKRETLEQEKRDMLHQIELNPRNSFDVLDKFISRHADVDSQQRFEETQLKIQTLQQESDTLQAIRAHADGNIVEAITGYQHYIESHPNSHLAYSYLGGALQKAQDWDASLEAYRHGEQIAGDATVASSIMRLHIGMLLQEKGDLEAAILQYRRIIEAVPSELNVTVTSAYFYLGNALNAQGKRSEARSAWKQAAKRDNTKIISKKVREMLKANP